VQPVYRRHQSPLSGRTGQLYPPPDSRSQSADCQSKADAQERNHPEKSGAVGLKIIEEFLKK